MGSKLLKVIGILMIIFAGIAIVLECIAMAGVAAAASLGASTGMYWLALILGAVGAVLELVAGIIGVKNWNKPEKAQTCVILGIVIIAFQILSDIFTLVSYSQNFNVLSAVLGLVIPVLYLIGAFQLKKQA